MSWFVFLRDNARWLTAGFLLSFTSSYGQTFFISVFAAQIMAANGLSDGQWGGVYTLGTTASAIAMVWAGTLVDRFRARMLGQVFLVLLAAACVLMSLANSALMLVFAVFALRFTGQGMISHIAIVSMARWFVANRGRALSVGAMGFALGQAVLPVVFVALLATGDWRRLWWLAAALTLAMLPVLRGLLSAERSPLGHDEKTETVGMAGRHWTRRQALRDPLFWLMIPTLLGPAAWGTALFFQQVHLAQVKGWDHAGFVATFPLFTLTSVAATLISGWAVDRFGAVRLMPFYLLPFAVAFVALSYAQGLGLAAIGMMLVGLAVGSGATIPGAFMAEVYGTRFLGAIKALAAAVMVFGSAVGPGISGLLIDKGVDFPDQMAGIAIYFLVAAAMATLGVAGARRRMAAAPAA